MREHFAGYRSHTLVLAAFPAVAVAVLSALAGVPVFLVPILLVGVFVRRVRRPAARLGPNRGPPPA